MENPCIRRAATHTARKRRGSTPTRQCALLSVTIYDFSAKTNMLTPGSVQRETVCTVARFATPHARLHRFRAWLRFPDSRAHQNRSHRIRAWSSGEVHDASPEREAGKHDSGGKANFPRDFRFTTSSSNQVGKSISRKTTTARSWVRHGPGKSSPMNSSSSECLASIQKKR